MATRKKPADGWDEWVATRQPEFAEGLVAMLEDTSLPKLEARFLMLSTWPTTPEFGAAAASFFQRFPIRFREQLGTGVAALGVFLTHGGRAEALEKLETVVAPNALVPAWRDTVVQAVLSLLRRKQKPGAGSTVPATLPAGPRAALQEAWLALAKTRAPDALPLLLSRLTDGPATDVTQRLVSLIDFATDARIADAAVALIDRPIVRFDASTALFPVLALVLLAHADISHRQAAITLAEALPSFAWLERLFPTTAPPPRSTKTSSSVGPSSEHDFLTWLAEAPADLTRRQAFADWLLERGLPRGEFMALQLADRELTPKERTRVGALQKKHEKEWLRGFAKSLIKGSAVFTKGVLSSIELSTWGAEGNVPSAEEPQLATLERLGTSGGRSEPLQQLLQSRWLRSLRELTVQAVMLPAVPPVVLEQLDALGVHTQWNPPEFTVAAAAKTLESLSLPRLRRVSLFGDLRGEQAPVVSSTSWARRLHTLVVESLSAEVWFSSCRELGLTELEVREPAHIAAAHWRFTREPQAWRLQVALNDAKDADSVLETLGLLDPALRANPPVSMPPNVPADLREALLATGVTLEPD